MENEAIPLACVPGAIPAKERAGHFARARRLFGEAAEERRAWREGYAFRFAADAVGEVARFVANERKCCPFLEFEIVLESAGPVWLRLTGPVGTRNFLQAELGISAG